MANVDTLWQAVENLLAELKSDGVELSLDAHEQVSSTFMNGLRYGDRLEAHVEIESLRGKSTRKFAHLVVERLDSGRYEPLSYVL